MTGTPCVSEEMPAYVARWIATSRQTLASRRTPLPEAHLIFADAIVWLADRLEEVSSKVIPRMDSAPYDADECPCVGCQTDPSRSVEPRTTEKY